MSAKWKPFCQADNEEVVGVCAEWNCRHGDVFVSIEARSRTTWTLYCEYLRLFDVDLKITDVDEAKAKALQIVKAEAESVLATVKAIIRANRPQ